MGCFRFGGLLSPGSAHDRRVVLGLRLVPLLGLVVAALAALAGLGDGAARLLVSAGHVLGARPTCSSRVVMIEATAFDLASAGAWPIPAGIWHGLMAWLEGAGARAVYVDAPGAAAGLNLVPRPAPGLVYVGDSSNPAGTDAPVLRVSPRVTVEVRHGLDHVTWPADGADPLQAALARLERPGAPGASRGAPGFFPALRGLGGGEAFESYSFASVLGDDVPAASFRGRLVLVGVTVPGADTLVDTPVGAMNVLTLRANVAQAFLDGAVFRPWGPGGSTLLAAAACLLLLWLPRGRGTAWLLGAPVAFLLGALGGGLLLLGLAGQVVDLLPLVLTVVLFVPLRVLGDGVEDVYRRRHRMVPRDEDVPALREGQAALAAGRPEEAERLVAGEAGPRAHLVRLLALLAQGRVAATLPLLETLPVHEYQPAELAALADRLLAGELLEPAGELVTHLYLTAPGTMVEGLMAEAHRLRVEKPMVERMEDLRPLFGERFKHLEFLDRGGMALVFRGLDVERQVPVAVKLLLPEYAGAPRQVARFVREARMLAGFEHPALVRVYDVSEQPAWYSMELIEGRTLADVLQTEDQLELPRALRYADELLAVLAYVHGRGVIHRDVKPANLIIDGRDAVRLLDFGVAHQECVTTLTQTGTVLGTPWYMAPEQALGAPVDERADLYSVALILYQLLSGELPFPCELSTALGARQYRPLSRYRPDLPAGLSDVLAQGYAKAARDRFSSVAEFRAALRPYAAGSA